MAPNHALCIKLHPDWLPEAQRLGTMFCQHRHGRLDCRVRPAPLAHSPSASRRPGKSKILLTLSGQQKYIPGMSRKQALTSDEQEELTNAAQLMGRRGGKKGGHARAARLTKLQRTEIARMGGLASARKRRNDKTSSDT